MRVLLDRGNAPPRGGIGVYTEGLLEALQHHGGHGIEASIAPFGSSGESLRLFRRGRYLLDVARGRRAGFGGANIVHFTNYYVPPPVPGIAYAATIHDLDTIRLAEAHGIAYPLYFREAVRRAARNADKLVTYTRSVRSELAEYTGVAEKDIGLIVLTLSAGFVRAAANCPRVEPDEPSLLFVGKLTRKKNLAWAVNAVARGVRTGALPPMRFRLAGSPGYGFEELRKAVDAAAGIAEWTLSPSLDRVVELYRTSSILVFPSLREGFGIPLLEAMWCGLPIVASDIPSSREVAGDVPRFFTLGSEEQFYAAVREALSQVGDAGLRARSDHVLSRYSPAEMARTHLDAYRSAIDRAANRHD